MRIALLTLTFALGMFAAIVGGLSLAFAHETPAQHCHEETHRAAC